jgi:type II secretory pathway component PulM
LIPADPSARQVQNAAQLASALTSDPAELEEFIRRSVQQSQRALGREQMEDLRDSVTQYDLANLNVDGRTSYTSFG